MKLLRDNLMLWTAGQDGDITIPGMPDGAVAASSTGSAAPPAGCEAELATAELEHGLEAPSRTSGVARRNRARTRAGAVTSASSPALEQSPGGRGIELRIDNRYVGWLKGRKGKVVRDLQARSGTRIDVDQGRPGLCTATVKIFGDARGTARARALVAAELHKVSPQAAVRIVGGGRDAAPRAAGCGRKAKQSHGRPAGGEP